MLNWLDIILIIVASICVGAAALFSWRYHTENIYFNGTEDEIDTENKIRDGIIRGINLIISTVWETDVEAQVVDVAQDNHKIIYGNGYKLLEVVTNWYYRKLYFTYTYKCADGSIISKHYTYRCGYKSTLAAFNKWFAKIDAKFNAIEEDLNKFWSDVAEASTEIANSSYPDDVLLEKVMYCVTNMKTSKNQRIRESQGVCATAILAFLKRHYEDDIKRLKIGQAEEKDTNILN